MTVSNAISELWATTATEAAHADGYYRRRLALDDPRPVYAGTLRPDNLRCLFIEINNRVNVAVRQGVLESSALGFDVRIAPSASGKSFVQIQETRSFPHREIFHLLCTDLVTKIGGIACETEVTKILADRLFYWTKFFSARSIDGLSREQYVGLYAELDFMTLALENGLQKSAIVRGWQGPLGGNQDFMLGQIAIELKGCSSNVPDEVRISNTRQLDCLGAAKLFLCQFVYDFRLSTGQRTLAELVKRVRRLLAGDSSLLVFEDRLLASGYLEMDDSSFAKFSFTKRFHRFYSICDEFPRILEKMVPTGIKDVSYTLDLGACQKFKVEDSQVYTAIKFG